MGRRQERRAEPVHLDAAVVDVELARHRGTGGLEHPRHRVAHRRPPRVPQVQRPGRVGGDELDVHRRAGQSPSGRTPPPPTIARASSPCAAASSVMLRNPGPATSTEAIPASRRSRRPAPREVPRRQARLLRQLQRHVGRVVAVLGVAGSLDGDGSRQLDGGQVSGLDGVGQGAHEGSGRARRASWGQATRGLGALRGQRSGRAIGPNGWRRWPERVALPVTALTGAARAERT